MALSYKVRLGLTLLLFWFVGNVTWGQSFSSNALLFSRTQPSGSARIQGLGGTQASLGGDYSSALSNPAGLGMFNRSEFTFSIGHTGNSVQTDFQGGSFADSRSNLNIPGLSLVFHHATGREGFVGGSFAITLTRLNNFNTEYTYQGTNTGSSIIDYFIEEAYYLDPNEMLFRGRDFYNITALAYNNYLIDYQQNGSNIQWGSVLSPLRNEGEARTVRQQESIRQRGAQQQWSLAYGANFLDKIFVGASLGITSIRYRSGQTYAESNFTYNQDPSYLPINSLQVNEDYNISGNGVNFSLGVITRPIDMLQLGVSYVTPTAYQLTDSYDASVSSRWNNFDYNGDGTLRLNSVSEQFDSPLISDYSFQSPHRLTVGGSLISKIGFITADVEFVNYSKARYSTDQSGLDFIGDNENIRRAYTSTVNYRAGAEYRYKILRVRAGYNVMADPFRDNANLDRSIHSFSAGLGARFSNFFVDAAFITSKTQGRRVPYITESYPTPLAVQDFTRNNVVLTVGFNFAR